MGDGNYLSLSLSLRLEREGRHVLDSVTDGVMKFFDPYVRVFLKLVMPMKRATIKMQVTRRTLKPISA